MINAAHRPPHCRPTLILLVASGGAVGTAARYGLGLIVGTADGWPTATFAANVLGALLLGVLLEALARRGHENEARRKVRLALGTGLLGGFTTFSTLAIEVERLAAAGDVVLGLCYALASVVAGVTDAFLGVMTSARLNRRVARVPRQPRAGTRPARPRRRSAGEP